MGSTFQNSVYTMLQLEVCLCVCMHAQSCPTLYNPMDCSPLGSSVHGIFQAKILEKVAIYYSRGSSCVSCISCISRQILHYWAIWEALVCVCVCVCTRVHKCLFVNNLHLRKNIRRQYFSPGQGTGELAIRGGTETLFMAMSYNF